MTPPELLYWIGIAAVAVCAVTGALDAGRKNMDIVGATAVGLATAAGGGTVRDLLLDRSVFWVADQTYLVAALLATTLSFFVVRATRLHPRLFLVPDALGLGLFTVLGTQIALDHGSPWLVASLMGVITGVLGGVLRDMLCNDIPLIFLPGELYATAAFAGAISLVGAQSWGLSHSTSAIIGFVVATGLRLGAMAFRWQAPRWTPDDGV